MTALLVWAVVATLVAAMQTIRARDFKVRLDMPTLPPPIEFLKPSPRRAKKTKKARRK